LIDIDTILKPFGLVLLGSSSVDATNKVPDVSSGQVARQLLMIGNGGASLWPVFSGSDEYLDGRPDPLDRWSRRIGTEVAAQLGARAIFPFDGPPYPPFISWSLLSGSVVTSPLAMLIHKRFGLWHAYRFALALPVQGIVRTEKSEYISPCLDCVDQPCLQACPVDAFGDSFGDGEYRVRDCVDYLKVDPQTACRLQGCGARRACPEARAFTYLPQQAQFHMQAFVESQSGDIGI